MKKNKYIIVCISAVVMTIAVLASMKLWGWIQDVDTSNSIEMLKIMDKKIGVHFPENSHLILYKESTFRDIVIYASVSIPSVKLAEFKSKTPINRIGFMKLEAERGCKDLELSFDHNFQSKSISHWEYGSTNDNIRGDSITVYIEYLKDGTSVVYIMYFK